MRSELTYMITENDKNKKVAAFLQEQGFSRRLLEDIRHQKGAVTLDNKEVSPDGTVSCGQVLRVLLPPEKNDDWITPENIPLHIVYEDEDLLVIDKDAGMLVHPTPNHEKGTLANALAYYFAEKKEPFTFRIVNRLDQDTSGLLIIPRHAFSASILGREVADHQIERVYLAAAKGDVRDVFPTGEGIIDAPIARVSGEGMLREVDFENGDTAISHVTFLGYKESLNTSLCAVTLEHGRTHQIRVHFAYIHHPLPGDFLYHPDMRLIGRQALHSYRLSFRHPITAEGMSFEAPLPEDMRQFIPEDSQGRKIDV